jgi:hypothetical protein
VEQGAVGRASTRMARTRGRLENRARRANARPWWLGRGGCGGDGNRRKKRSVRPTVALGSLFIRVPLGPPIAAPSTVRSSLQRLCADNLTT